MTTYLIKAEVIVEEWFVVSNCDSPEEAAKKLQEGDYEDCINTEFVKHNESPKDWEIKEFV